MDQINWAALEMISLLVIQFTTTQIKKNICSKRERCSESCRIWRSSNVQWHIGDSLKKMTFAICLRLLQQTDSTLQAAYDSTCMPSHFPIGHFCQVNIIGVWWSRHYGELGCQISKKSLNKAVNRESIHYLLEVLMADGWVEHHLSVYTAEWRGLFVGRVTERAINR